MNPTELRQRMKAYALRVLNLCRSLPPDEAARILGRQLLGAGTSVGANYRSAGLGKSRSDFINKLKIAEEECDESLYWMELLVDSGIVHAADLASLQREGAEILAILIASIRTARSRP